MFRHLQVKSTTVILPSSLADSASPHVLQSIGVMRIAHARENIISWSIESLSQDWWARYNHQYWVVWGSEQLDCTNGDEEVRRSTADALHSHVLSDVSGLQTHMRRDNYLLWGCTRLTEWQTDRFGMEDGIAYYGSHCNKTPTFNVPRDPLTYYPTNMYPLATKTLRQASH